jgi:dTDP-4-amino-4,6-dideoxygalactose transaminase
MIPVFKPKIRTEEILSELKSVLDSGWIGLGPKVKEFEELIKNHLKCDYVVGTNSCTSSIHMALKAINRNNKKKYVISTPMTFVSTNHCILYENQQPIFCDIEPTTGVIDPQSFEEACMKYGNDINAAIIVHIAGYSAEMNEINKIADKYGIKIIEDCAHAFGGRYNQKMIGEDSQNIHCWSFQAVKNMPIGDGGAISTSDPELDKYFRKMRWLGIDADTVTRSTGGYKWEYDVPEVGYKYHLNDILAAIGCVQIKYIDSDNARRKEIANYYKNNIKDGIKPDYKENRDSSYHFYPMFFENRDEIYEKLTKNSVFPSMHYRSNTRYQMYKDAITINECRNVSWYEKHVLSLPIHLHLSDEQIQNICNIINE